MNGASMLLRRLLFLQCVYFWAGAAHANDVAARCGGGRWAVVLSDGYVVGTFGGVYETGNVPRSSEFSPMRDVLVNTASAGGVFLRYYGEIEVRKELGGAPSRYFFARNGGGIRYFTSAPVEAIFPVESMKGDRCLEKALVIDDLREEFPKKDGCGSLGKSISKLRSPEYQDAIDEIASIEYSQGGLECLVDYIADTSVLYSTEFWVPYGRSYYHAPFDTVGALVEMLISGKLDVRAVESPRTESEHELHRLAWRDFLEYRKRNPPKLNLHENLKDVLKSNVSVDVSLPACAVDGCGTMQDEQLEAAGWGAVQVGDFGRAIKMVLPMAAAGDPEAEFAVGDLALLWLEADAPKEPPEYTLDEAVAWIRKAAAKSLPQAAGFLRSGYEWGRYTLPKNAELAGCWRRVEDGEQDANVCLAAETSVN